MILNVKIGLYIVAILLIVVPIGILRLNYLVDEIAVAILDTISVFLTPDGVFVLKPFDFPSHPLKFLIQFRSVAVTVQKFSQ